MTNTDARIAAAELLKNFKPPENRRVQSVYVGHRLYRSEQRCVVGYYWHRPYAHHLSGLVYEAVLGYGNTFSAAIERMKDRVAESPR